jgi:hypothetical protein
MQIVVERFETQAAGTQSYVLLGLLPATPISLTADELSKILIALPRAA